MKILFVEDDLKIAFFVKNGLQEAGFVVDHLADGESGLYMALNYKYDAAIVDLMLPKLDGLTLIKSIRSRKDRTPVLILSARRSLNERIEGLEIGADDYLTKPFSFAELLARLKALLRRANPGLESSVLTVSNLTVDLSRRKATRGENAIELQPLEFKLLVYLMRNGGQIVSKTMKSAQHYLAIFRKLFLWVIGVSIVAAGVSGLFMARRALSGISRVTHTAQKISQGNLQERVATANQCREIRHLADTFNLMLDRIEDLIHRMQEVTENIAHDLRSPLSRIRGIAEMSLISTTQAVTPAQAAENTIEECDSLIRIINTMLDLTEIEAGVNKFDLQQVDLNQILRSACDLFETLAHEQGIEITLQMTEGVVVQSNRPQLQRLVYNLIDNAIKYTPSGGAVTIRAEAAPQHVLISVTDTGCGIPPDELPHIFDRFYRVDQSRSKPGSGLGLSLARAIAHALKGTINVTSQIEEGSCFTVALPQPA
ncbi:MAG: ATP-binding protein [Desulfobacterales bacterium]